VLVSIDASNDFPPDKSAIIAYDGRGTPGSAVAKSTQNDLGEALDLDSLLASDHNGESGSPYGPVDAYGQADQVARQAFAQGECAQGCEVAAR